MAAAAAAAAAAAPSATTSTTILHHPSCSVLTCIQGCDNNCLLGKRLLAMYDDDGTFTVSNYASGLTSTLRSAINYSERRPKTPKYFWLWVELLSKRVVVIQPPRCFEAGKIMCSFNNETSEVVVKLV